MKRTHPLFTPAIRWMLLATPLMVFWFGCPPAGGPPPAPGSAVAPAGGSAATPTLPVAPGAPTSEPAAAGAPAAGVNLAGLNREELQEKAKQSIEQGLNWLKTQQAENGSYYNHPGVTAMVLQAFLQSPKKYRESDGPFVARAVSYLAGLQKPNGAIFDKNLPNYNTALALLALHATGNPAYREVIRKGQEFLVGIQAAEAQKYRPVDKFYGGIGYGNSERPDLPNLQFALEALATTGYQGDQAPFKKALTFIERCQNRSESNDQPWAGNDGGFVYNPGESKAGGTQSYGSMTYAGLLSLMYCNLERSDPRVADALRWIKAHWDLETHPGMGDTGLYFYYHTLAKALSVYGEPTLTDAQGRTHDWAAELIQALVKRQNPEGWWQNSNPEYWEGNKLLATARALLALEGALGLTHEARTAAAARATEAPAGSPAVPAAAGTGAPAAVPAAPPAPPVGN